jgi:hypothetical protein
MDIPGANDKQGETRAYLRSSRHHMSTCATIQPATTHATKVQQTKPNQTKQQHHTIKPKENKSKTNAKETWRQEVKQSTIGRKLIAFFRTT